MKSTLLLILLLGLKLTDVFCVTANFTASKVFGCAPLVVNFTDASTAGGIPPIPISSWSYDFGDGGTSNIQHPKYTFTKSGSFKVKLTVSDGSSTSSYTITIKVLKSPNADFIIQKAGYCPGETVQFTNKTTLGDTDIRSSNWDFGDGNILSAKGDVTKVYTLAGLYTVKLSVKDNSGCQSIMTKTQFVSVDAGPKADFVIVSKFTCTSPRKVNFVNKSSGNSATYFWDMGNGNTFTDPNPVDFYTSAGTYNVNLTAITTNGCTHKKTIPLVIDFVPLKCDFIPDKAMGCIPFDPGLKNKSTPTGINVDYAWDFGDGSKSTAENPSKMYSKTGTYNIKFKISGYGCSDSITKSVVVSDKPKTTLSMSDTVECDGVMDIVLKAPSTSNIINRTWYIDGRNINTKSDSLKYSFGKFDPADKLRRPGIYKIYVSLQDFAGCEEYVQFPDVVVQYMQCGFEYFAFGGCVPFTPNLRDTSIIDVGSKIFYNWEDGIGGKYYTKSPKITYPNEGVFMMTLTISDTFGCVSEELKQVKVGKKIKPSFRMDKKVICNNEKISFYNTTPDNLKKDAHSWKWTLMTTDGDNKDSFFAVMKDYPAQLTPRLISENNECRDTLEKEDSITLNPPLADFLVHFDTCYNNTVRLTQNSKVITSFKWLLADGTSSTSKELIFKVKPFKETYMLVAYNATYGCIDTVKQEIEPPTPMSDMHVKRDPNSACTPQSFIIDNSKLKISRTHWDFGDGDTSDIPDPYGWLDPDDTFKHSYSQPGTYIIVHSAWNRWGCLYSTRDTVKVVGPSVASSIWPMKGCLPLKIHLVDSFAPDFPNKIKRKYWRIEDADSLIPASNKDSTIEYTIDALPRSGDSVVNVELFVEDVKGCVSSRMYKIRPSAPKAYIDVNKKLLCDVMQINLEMVIDSFSTVLPATVEWKMGDGKTITDNKFSYVYEKAGYYMVKVKLKDALGCSFSDEFEIGASQPELFAKFDMDNRYAVCPPLITQFTESCIIDPGNPVTEYLWDFGDGTTSSVRNPGKIFTLPGTFDISLTIKNQYGCTNTKVWKKAIYIGGPSGVYKLGSTTGCQPLTAHFEISEDPNTIVEWDYGNGKTVLANKTEYTYLLPGIYYPKIILKDSGGCTVVMIPKDSILVLTRPSADFTFNSYCLDDSIVFNNNSISQIQGQPALNSRWIVEKDTIPTNHLTHKFGTKGNFPVSLIIENDHHCYDTIEQDITISKPLADFVSLKDKLCLGDSLLLLNKSTSDIEIHSFRWKVDMVEVDLGTYRPPIGDRTVQLIVTDIMNCRDTFDLVSNIRVADTLPPLDIMLSNVSALTDHQFELRYLKTADPDFLQYNVYHFENGVWKIIQKISDANAITTLHTDNGMKQSQCFKITQSNYCKAESELINAIQHCSIHTTATADINRNLLSWNPYVGWPVLSYKISRQNIISPSIYDSLDLIDGGATNYIDTGIVCNVVHAYKVTAYGNSPERISQSDSAKAKALWTNNLPTPEISYVTVDMDTSIIVKWQLNNSYKRSKYQDMLLYKSYALGSNIQSLNLLANDFNDRKVSVDKYQYQYYARVTDDCGDTSSASLTSTNILVQSLSDGTFDPPEFKWNRYGKWIEGVKHYEVQRMNENKVFETIQLTNDTFYKDIDAIDICMRQYRYRVIAIKNSSPSAGQAIKSLSNEIRIKPKSSLFVPNAFTPNNNGLNEIFAPKGQYIYNYQLEIYNRWGERVFISTDCLAGWDGTYQDEIAKEGIYYFKMSAFGNDGVIYNFKGTLTLLK